MISKKFIREQNVYQHWARAQTANLSLNVKPCYKYWLIKCGTFKKDFCMSASRGVNFVSIYFSLSSINGLTSEWDLQDVTCTDTPAGPLRKATKRNKAVLSCRSFEIPHQPVSKDQNLLNYFICISAIFFYIRTYCVPLHSGCVSASHTIITTLIIIK